MCEIYSAELEGVKVAVKVPRKDCEEPAVAEHDLEVGFVGCFCLFCLGGSRDGGGGAWGRACALGDELLLRRPGSAGRKYRLASIQQELASRETW